MKDFSVHAATHAAVCQAGFIASAKTSAAWLAATKYDGVEVKSILINKTKVG